MGIYQTQGAFGPVDTMDTPENRQLYPPLAPDAVPPPVVPDFTSPMPGPTVPGPASPQEQQKDADGSFMGQMANGIVAANTPFDATNVFPESKKELADIDLGHKQSAQIHAKEVEAKQEKFKAEAAQEDANKAAAQQAAVAQAKAVGVPVRDAVDYRGQFNQGEKEALKANQNAAALNADISEQNAAMQQDSLDKQKVIALKSENDQNEAQEVVMQQMRNAVNLQKEVIEPFKYDPHAYWEQKGMGPKVLATIATVLSGGQHNYLNEMVEKDLEKSKAEYANRLEIHKMKAADIDSAFSKGMSAGMSSRQSSEFQRATSKDLLAQQITQYAESLGDQVAKNNALAASGKLKMDAASHKANLQGQFLNAIQTKQAIRDAGLLTDMKLNKATGGPVLKGPQIDQLRQLQDAEQAFTTMEQAYKEANPEELWDSSNVPFLNRTLGKFGLGKAGNYEAVRNREMGRALQGFNAGKRVPLGQVQNEMGERMLPHAGAINGARDLAGGHAEMLARIAAWKAQLKKTGATDAQIAEGVAAAVPTETGKEPEHE